jgi:hypothetical protein
MDRILIEEIIVLIRYVIDSKYKTKHKKACHY